MAHYKLHFNRDNGLYSVRHPDRSVRCVFTLGFPEHFLGKLLGYTVELERSHHAIVTSTVIREATAGKRPALSVIKTRFPFVRLVLARIKEVFCHVH